MHTVFHAPCSLRVWSVFLSTKSCCSSVVPFIEKQTHGITMPAGAGAGAEAVGAAADG